MFDIASLQRFLDDSPTPHHVVASAARLLLDAGFTWFDERSEFPDFSGAVVRGFVARDGAIIAFATSSRANDRFNVVGAHTDSPGLHLKPRPEGTASNFGTLDVEVYGSPLLNSWLDRDLDLAGHVVLKNGARRLFRSNAPVARLPQLAIHLDRTVNESGLVLDKHAHLRPVWTTGNDDLTLRQWVARATAVPNGEIATVHAQLVDSTPASL
ncbi:MAG: M18 family aminopeptidase, partial [Ilumatobacteraceae bacterium]